MRSEIQAISTGLAALVAIFVATSAIGEGPNRVEKKLDIVDTVSIWSLEPDGDRLRVVTRGHKANGDMGPIAERFIVDEHTIVRSGDDVIEPSALAIGDRVVIEATEEPDLPKRDQEPVQIAREILVVVDVPRPQNDTPN